MKINMLFATLGALCAASSLLLANPPAQSIQEASMQPFQDEGLVPSQELGQNPGQSAVLPGSLTPGALGDLGSALLLDEPGDGRTWARGSTMEGVLWA